MKKNFALLWQGKDAIVYYRNSSNSDSFWGLQEKKVVKNFLWFLRLLKNLKGGDIEDTFWGNNASRRWA